MNKCFLLLVLAVLSIGCRHVEDSDTKKDDAPATSDYRLRLPDDVIQQRQEELNQWIKEHSVDFTVRAIKLNDSMKDVLKFDVIPYLKSMNLNPKKYAIYLYEEGYTLHGDEAIYDIICSIEEFPEIDNEEWRGYCYVDGFTCLANHSLVRDFANTTETTKKFRCIPASDVKIAERQWKYRLVYNFANNVIDLSKISETESASKIAKINMILEVDSFDNPRLDDDIEFDSLYDPAICRQTLPPIKL